MTFTQFKEMLGETGLDNTYYSWPENEAPQLPYLVWYLPNSENFAADDSVYQRIDTLNVELYTETKNFDLEQTVEAVLNRWEMVWEKSESYIESEHMYEVLYTMEVIINATGNA